MGNIFIGLDRGETEIDVVEDTSTQSKDVEVNIDDAVSLTKEEVMRYMRMIENYLIKRDNF